jgi:hypothetical protein
MKKKRPGMIEMRRRARGRRLTSNPRSSSLCEWLEGGLLRFVWSEGREYLLPPNKTSSEDLAMTGELYV